jgi:short-subunit dehydrogenase
MKRGLKFLFGLAVVSALALLLGRRRYLYDGKVVLITGGSRGLGLVLARQLGSQGAKLMLVARDGTELARAAEELAARGFSVETMACDVAEEAAASRVVDETVRRFGQLDMVINNAGIIVVGPLEQMLAKDYEEAMAVHFWAPLRFMTAALPYLRKTRGKIVNISSIGGKIAVPHMAPYCASKFALAGLSDAFRAELARQGIGVVSVFPGMMRTGSHIHARFKGQPGKEFAWFALGGATPFTSASAERAAREILRGCSRGAAEVVVTVQARAIVIVAALFPNITGKIIGLVNRLLPASGGMEQAVPGSVARGGFPPKGVMAELDRASEANNATGGKREP